MTFYLNAFAYIKDIQDLDMSPRSKHKTLEKEGKQQSLSRGSLIDETDETEESENYIELNKSKMKKEQLFGIFFFCF